MSVNEYVFRDGHIGVRIVVTPADYAFAGQNDCVIMYKNVSTTRENLLHLQGHTTFSSPLMQVIYTVRGDAPTQMLVCSVRGPTLKCQRKSLVMKVVAKPLKN